MSTLRTNNIKNESSASNNIVLDSSGGIIVSGISTFSSEINLGTGTTISSPASNEFAISTNDAYRMIIDSSGRVTMPYQPAFSAKNVGGAALNGNIVLNTIILNNGGHYSTSTGNFTAPIAGMYYFSFTGFTENNSSGGQNIAIQKNGTDIVRTYTDEASGIYRPFAVDCIVYLSANDSVRPNSGIDIHGNYNPTFSGYLIG